MMPFGGHKGSSIAFMIEVLAAGLTGGRFGFEDNSAAYPGAQTSNAGEVVILIDPLHIEESHFFERIELLLEHIAASGAERLPSEHRYERRERWRKLNRQRAHHRNWNRGGIAPGPDLIVID